MYYKVLSANSLVELQNTVNEHINSGYQLQGGLVVESIVTVQESGKIVPRGEGPIDVSESEYKGADRWTNAIPERIRTTYLQAVYRNPVSFDPGAKLTPHIADN